MDGNQKNLNKQPTKIYARNFALQRKLVNENHRNEFSN